MFGKPPTPFRKSRRNLGKYSDWQNRRHAVEFFDSDEVMSDLEFLRKYRPRKREEKHNYSTSYCNTVWFLTSAAVNLSINIVRYLLTLSIWLVWKFGISMASTVFVYVAIFILLSYLFSLVPPFV
ncbi:uncharacterized protein LOC108253856 isoform X2 [Diaphorina citri]|uniref:Uncharacterized protein LOC108253856 isoform X1 n=1 Tax=Diaphorina citri TaxID=121845 RepID=A0A3Q0JFY5_DIACI|nr:uncharacterized protein LOC108253856 isoform X1 [Diaphorina citri]XP_026687282.1 uncharacterized protein LOC108253856 isoform X2 [Diaphorina citri]